MSYYSLLPVLENIDYIPLPVFENGDFIILSSYNDY